MIFLDCKEFSVFVKIIASWAKMFYLEKFSIIQKRYSLCMIVCLKIEITVSFPLCGGENRSSLCVCVCVYIYMQVIMYIRISLNFFEWSH